MKDKRMRRYRLGAVFLAAAVFLSAGARMWAGFADWYCGCVYSFLVGIIGQLTGVFHFSVAEFLLYGLIAGVTVTAIRNIWLTLMGNFDGIAGDVSEKKEKNRKTVWLNWISSLFLLASFLILIYVVNCGINYQRTSFAEMVGIETDGYSAEELYAVCLWLVEDVNGWSAQVARDADGVMMVSDVSEGAVAAMEKLGMRCPQLAGYYPQPKPVTFSQILSVQQLSGVYSPFTIEANYNNAMTDYNRPFTACHELSHLRGFMQEQEANFIAFLACQASDDAQFRYSGSMLGLLYCMNELYRIDREAWQDIQQAIVPEVKIDFRANNDFWKQYDGSVAEMSTKVNDTYLKANGQTEGVKSYDRMTDLIAAYWRTNKKCAQCF